MFATRFYVMNAVLKRPIPSLAEWLVDTAALQEAHEVLSVIWDNKMPGPPDFRRHSAALIQGLAASKNKDREQLLALAREHEATLLSINMNANYIVMRSLRENDERIRHNAGYPLKEQVTRSHALIPIRTDPMVITVKKGSKEASVVVRFEKDQGAGLYQLQYCKGIPAGEDSFGEITSHKTCRVVVNDLELANWYYFRGRSHGDNEASPWSKPVGIIIT